MDVKFQEKYFTPRGHGKKNPGGKIYNSIVNCRQKLAKRKRSEDNHRYQTKGAEHHQANPVEEAALKWLRLNTEPWSLTLENWVLSFGERKSNLKNPNEFAKVLKNFRHYRGKFGYQLVSSYGFLNNRDQIIFC